VAPASGYPADHRRKPDLGTAPSNHDPVTVRQLHRHISAELLSTYYKVYIDFANTKIRGLEGTSNHRPALASARASGKTQIQHDVVARRASSLDHRRHRVSRHRSRSLL